jgi:hypothetical protein
VERRFPDSVARHPMIEDTVRVTHRRLPVEEAVVQRRRLVNDAMDLGDRNLGSPELGHVEAFCLSNLAHGRQQP